MTSLVMNGLDTNEGHLNDHNISILSPELSFSPFLRKLFLQENNSLTMLPPSVFQCMPVLQVLDLSHTSIQSLPPSISRLRSLEEFILRECSLLMEVPPEIGALKNLKLFDLEGTEIMYLPKEIGKLKSLECLRVSLSTYADDHKERYGVEHIIPRKMISKLTKLKELSISIDPEADWWEVELLEAIMGDLLFLADLKTLKLYLPTVKALRQFLKLERYSTVPIYSRLRDYRFLIGRCEQLPLSVQLDIEENFMKLEKCVKYMNGEGYTDETGELIRNATALYLRRHWTIEKLSMFDIRNLKYCLLMECNEMQTVVDHEDFCKHKDKVTSHGEDEILGSMQYLSIHLMKKLQRILKGPSGRKGLSCLRILALHTCPELTSIFTGCLLDSMQSLNELIVEDCPKVKSLVNLEDGTPQSNGPFLLNLTRVSLLHLPELVSISSGVCVAPKLDTLLVFNCMKLDYLSVMEIPRGIKAIKGEIEWWDALKFENMTWHGIFVQLKRDGDLMDELAADTNSLQHFLELVTFPSHAGNSLQVDQNLLSDYHQVGCNHLYTKEDQELFDLLEIDHVPSSEDAQKTLTKKILNSNNKAPNHKHASIMKKCNIVTSKYRVKVSKGVEVEQALDDGYNWKKYGQKEILCALYPRMYYRCSFRYTHDCQAKKHVVRSTEDSSVFEVSYTGKHTCPTVFSSNCSSAVTELACRPLGYRDTLTATESASTVTDSFYELPTSPQVLDANKKDGGKVTMGLSSEDKATFERIIRIPVREEVERVFKVLFDKLPRSPSDTHESSSTTPLQLRFLTKPSPISFTGSRVESEDNNTIKVVLFDPNSNGIVSYGPLASLKILIVLLDGDFSADDHENWSQTDFDTKVIYAREGKRPLLTGDVVLTLKEGVADLHNVYFTHNSSWRSSRKFKLGAKAQNPIGGVRIREAKSEAFVVKDCRVGGPYKKHQRPFLVDQIWCLDNIARKGSLHTRLKSHNIKTLKDFLQVYTTNESLLYELYGGPNNNKWKAIIKQAKSCVLDDKVYMYNCGTDAIGIMFNSVLEVVGATFDGVNRLSMNELDDIQKSMVEVLKQKIYRKLGRMVPINDLSLVATPVLAASLHDDLLRTSNEDTECDVKAPNYKHASIQKGYNRYTNAEKQVPIADDDMPIWNFVTSDSTTATKSVLEILAGVLQLLQTQLLQSPDNYFGLDSTQM